MDGPVHCYGFPVHRIPHTVNRLPSACYCRCHYIGIERGATSGYNVYMKAKTARPGSAQKKHIQSRRTRVVNVALGFRQAREWEIQQEISMTPGQRQRAAKVLKERFYGCDAPDVRASHVRR